MDQANLIDEQTRQLLEELFRPVDADWERKEAEDVQLGEAVFFVGVDGEERAAVVVKTWKQYHKDMVNLVVFLDGTNDREYSGYVAEAPSHVRPGGPNQLVPILAFWATSVHWAHKREKKPYSWHY